MGRVLDCFCKSIHFHTAFNQSHPPLEGVGAIPDSYEKCTPGEMNSLTLVACKLRTVLVTKDATGLVERHILDYVYPHSLKIGVKDVKKMVICTTVLVFPGIPQSLLASNWRTKRKLCLTATSTTYASSESKIFNFNDLDVIWS